MLYLKKMFHRPKKNFNRMRHFAFLLILIFAINCSKSSPTPAPTPTPVPTPTPTTTPAVVPPIDTNSSTAKEIILDMSAGFNLGNTFESNTSNSPTFASVKPIIDLYYDAGMRHVRIPVTWMQGFPDNIADGNGLVNTAHPRLQELKLIVDYALTKKMYVEINTHHEHWLKDFYDGSAAFDDKFKTLWTGIATFFKDEPKQLLFDVLNEPEGKMGQWSGTGYPLPTDPTAIALTRQIDKVAYDAIRATGGNNATRVIMVEPNGQGNQGQISQVFASKANLPGAGTDAYLAIQVHTYDPWAFCGETGANSAFPGNGTFTTGIQKVATQAAILDVPVNYGEFGVGRKSGTERNTDIVRGYYKTMKQTCIANKMSCTAWDDRGWFGLINTSGATPAFSNNIVPYMMAQ
ncbi:glycoside hydrolase family 5 protein [soil metagenome]